MTEFAKGQVPGRGDDPARGPRRGGPLPAAHLAQLPRAGDRLHPPRRGPRHAYEACGDGVLVAAFGDPGHVFPAIALGRALRGRGHEVTIETWEERRAAVEGAGLGFAAAEEYRMFPPPDPDSAEGEHAAEAARALLPLLEEMRPHAVVSDILTLAPSLAAEKAGVPLATLIPHIYPVVEPGPALLRDRPEATANAARTRRLAHRAARPQHRPRARPARPQPPARSASTCRRSSASTAASAPSWRWSAPSRSSSTRASGRPGSRSPAR